MVMEADNDAGAVSTYVQAGGRYGLHLLWLLIVLLPICYLVQEMVARLGIATGKGHTAMMNNPGCNRDRRPVWLGGVRMHVDFL